MAFRIAPPTPPAEAGFAVIANPAHGPATAAQLRARAHAAKAAWHEQEARRSPKEKVAILLRLQREVLPILRTRRGLAPHEKPWPIDP